MAKKPNTLDALYDAINNATPVASKGKGPQAPRPEGRVEGTTLILHIPLALGGLSTTGSSRSVARFPGTRITGTVAVVMEDGRVLSHEDLRLSCWGGVSLSSPNPQHREFFGLTEKDK